MTGCSAPPHTSPNRIPHKSRWEIQGTSPCIPLPKSYQISPFHDIRIDGRSGQRNLKSLNMIDLWRLHESWGALRTGLAPKVQRFLTAPNLFGKVTMRLHSRKSGFTLVEIMTVVALLLFLILIAVPTYFRARELSRQRACQENLQKLDGAKQQWALENNAESTVEPSWNDLVGRELYIRKIPICPGSGEYTLNTVENNPECSLKDQDPYPHEFEAAPPGG